MEIERKFLISSFPDHLPVVKEATVHQWYISTKPEFRLRKTQLNNGNVTYMLCHKTKGTLVREEIEVPITKKVYNHFLDIYRPNVIVKEYKAFHLGKYVLECSLVDSTFFYAEIEFESEEDALSFKEEYIPNLIKDITEDKNYKMASYWKYTRTANN